MNISNLSVGMKVKNFKELSKLIEGEGCKIRTGDSKKSFLKELSSYVIYDKIGHGFYIKGFHTTPVEVIDGRKKGNNRKYIEHTENLILHLLKRSKGDSVGYLTKTGFLLETNIVNDNFLKGKDDYGYLADYLRIPYDGVREFYFNYYQFFTNLIKNALTSLDKKRIIKVENRTMLILGDDSTKIATASEYTEIIDFEYSIRQELLAGGKHDNKTINIAIANESKARCFKELGYKRYFPVYKVFFSHEVLDMELTDESRQESKTLLNKAIEANINRTSSKNWKKYIDKNKPDFGVRHDLLSQEIYKNCAKDVFNSIALF